MSNDYLKDIVFSPRDKVITNLEAQIDKLKLKTLSYQKKIYNANDMKVLARKELVMCRGLLTNCTDLLTNSLCRGFALGDTTYTLAEIANITKVPINTIAKLISDYRGSLNG